MNRIAKFEKVSFEEFEKGFGKMLSNMDDIDCIDCSKLARDIYDNIKLPQRATKGSAGYDFFAPFKFELLPNESALIPSGIRVRMEEGWVLKGYPRSGLGFKFRMQMNNTVCIIDQDYYYSDNEGHIFFKITNDSREGKNIKVEDGMGFAQGIFVQYGITEDDNVEKIRNGGFGSTNK